MILTCPHCATQFVVDDSALGATGRRVRCSACQKAWFAAPAAHAAIESPPEPIPATEAGPAPSASDHHIPAEPAPAEDVAPIRHEPEPETDVQPISHFTPEPLPAFGAVEEPHADEPDAFFEPESEGYLFAPPPRNAPPPRRSASLSPLLLLAVMATLLAVFFILRKPIEKAAPALRPVYESMGLTDLREPSGPPVPPPGRSQPH
jgi:predicted Zn finger-like uncharacterized protein